jgi:hypothetical protein
MPTDDRGDEPRTFTFAAALEAVRKHLFGGAFDPLMRAVWCRKQRRQLRVPGRSVVWVRGEPAVQWAEWGARRGYFDVERMDGLAYLRASVA